MNVLCDCSTPRYRKGLVQVVPFTGNSLFQAQYGLVVKHYKKLQERQRLYDSSTDLSQAQRVEVVQLNACYMYC